MYQYYNPNPSNQHVGDCAVRAIAKATDSDWESVYIGLTMEGLHLYDMPASAYVIGMYLHKKGFEHQMIPSICPACTTIEKFAEEHPRGTYIAVTEGHMTAIQDGDYFDTWDSGQEIILYFYREALNV